MISTFAPPAVQSSKSSETQPQLLGLKSLKTLQTSHSNHDTTIQRSRPSDQQNVSSPDAQINIKIACL